MCCFQCCLQFFVLLSMNEIGDLTRTESSYICCVVAIKLTVFGAMRIQHHLITCIMRTMFLQCDGKHSWDTFTTSITILKLRRNNSPRKLLALTLGNHHFLKEAIKTPGDHAGMPTLCGSLYELVPS